MPMDSPESKLEDMDRARQEAELDHRRWLGA